MSLALDELAIVKGALQEDGPDIVAESQQISRGGFSMNSPNLAPLRDLLADTNRGPRVRFLLAFAGLTAVVVLAGASWIFARVSHPPAISLPTQCRAPIFLAHRSNSVELASAALRHGFCGVEVDVQWRDGFGLIVAHDALPETWSAAGSLSLPGLLDSVPQLRTLIWLDFKNLAPDNAGAAAAYLNEIMSRHGLHGRIIVEARQPLGLWRFHLQAPKTLPAYWVPDPPDGLRGLAFDTRLIVKIGLLGFSALSVPKRRLSADFANRFRRFAIFTWTCNTRDEFRDAVSRGARVILTDQPAPPAAYSYLRSHSGMSTSPAYQQR